MGRPNVNWNVGIATDKHSTYTSKAVKAGIPFASQVTEPNTKYIIKYDFSLGGDSVEIPEDCILEFDGGSLSNGNLVFDNTYIDSKTKCFDFISFSGTTSTPELHLAWINYSEHKCLQDFIDFAVAANRDINLDGLELTINDVLYIDRHVSASNVGNKETWMTIHEGTINIGTPYLFKTRYEVGQHPLSQYVCLSNIVFNNNNEATTVHYDDINTDVKVQDRVDVFFDNHFLRIRIEGCKFNNVSLVNATDNHYLQSYYVTGCLVYDLNYPFIQAYQAYDIHFINSSVERSHLSDVISISACQAISVISNVIESVNIAIKWAWGRGVTIIGNYFEGCHEATIKTANVSGNVSNGASIIGNRFSINPKDKFVDGIYYFMDFVGIIRDYIIQGNGFMRTTNDENKVVQDLIFRNWRSYGLYVPDTSATPDDLLGAQNYHGGNSVQTVTRSLNGNKVDNIGNLDPYGVGIRVPKTYQAEEFSLVTDDTTTPYHLGARRIHLDQTKVYYELGQKIDCLWRATLMDSRKPHVPWTYICRQTAEEADAYEEAMEEWEEGGSDPETMPDIRLRRTGWIKQMLMLDREWGSDYLDPNIGMPGSKIDFSESAYYNGLMRVDNNGIQYWYVGNWVRPDGIPVAYSHRGTTSNRPKLEEHSNYTSDTSYGGFMYFDTTINKPVWFCGYDHRDIGDNGWIDADGNNPYE